MYLKLDTDPEDSVPTRSRCEKHRDLWTYTAHRTQCGRDGNYISTLGMYLCWQHQDFLAGRITSIVSSEANSKWLTDQARSDAVLSIREEWSA